MFKLSKPFSFFTIAMMPFAVVANDAPITIENLIEAQKDQAGALPATEVQVNIAPKSNTKANKTLDIGKTGFPLPRFVSIKRDTVNVRKGPGENFGIAWTFTRKNLPLEITAEYESWRKIRDHEGAEGWVFKSLISGKRYVMVQPWQQDQIYALYSQKSESSSKVARLETGVLASLQGCDKIWCEIKIDAYNGFIKQDLLWGVYPDEEAK